MLAALLRALLMSSEKPERRRKPVPKIVKLKCNECAKDCNTPGVSLKKVGSKILCRWCRGQKTRTSF